MRMAQRLLFVSLLAAACSGPTEGDPTPGSRTVRGTFVLTDGGPAANASVSLAGTSWLTRASATGAFELPAVPAGSYVLVGEFDPEGDRVLEAAGQRRVTVSTEATTDLGKLVLGPPSQVLVTVLRGDEPLRNAQVVLERVAEARTDSFGDATFRMVPAGEYVAVASVRTPERGYEVSVGVPVSVAMGAVAEVTIDLGGAQAAGTPRTPQVQVHLSGRTDASGVEVLADGPAHFSRTTDATGLVKFEDAPPGIYTVRARASGFAPVIVPWVAFGSENVRIDGLTLAPAADTCPRPGALDSDGDGASDASEAACACDPTSSTDSDADGICDGPDLDDDGDGALDLYDNCPSAPNADQLDADGDGIGAACDVSDVRDTDRDDDAIDDDVDNCPDQPNHDQLDTDSDTKGNACDPDDDGDGFSDGEDACPLLATGDHADPDADGLGNACDDDADGDGALNAADSCPFAATGDHADPDGDGQGNTCDDDDDGDHVLDTGDNCPLVASSDLTDTDHDGRGNVCDDDDDGDGFPDATDTCVLVNSTNQTDRDDDGFGDLCDNCPDLDNNQADADVDGVGDACELPASSPLDRALCRGVFCLPKPGASSADLLAFEGLGDADAWLGEWPSRLHHWKGDHWETPHNPIEDDLWNDLGLVLDGIRERAANDVDAWFGDALIHWDGTAWSRQNLGEGAPVRSLIFRRVERIGDAIVMLDDKETLHGTWDGFFESGWAGARDLAEFGGTAYVVATTGRPSRLEPFESTFVVAGLGTSPLVAPEESHRVWALASGAWFDVWDGNTQKPALVRWAGGAWQRFSLPGAPRKVLGRSPTQATVLFEDGTIQQFTAPTTFEAVAGESLPGGLVGVIQVNASELWFAQARTLGVWKAGTVTQAVPIAPPVAPPVTITRGVDATYSLSATHVLRMDGGPLSSVIQLPFEIDPVEAKVWAASMNDVWLGTGNVLTRWNGTTWTPQAAPFGPGAAITVLKGSAANDVWIGTTEGDAVHWDGTTFTNAPLVVKDVHPAGARAWALDDGGRVYTWASGDPLDWIDVTPAGFFTPLTAIGGAGSGLIVAAGVPASLTSTTGLTSTSWTQRTVAGSRSDPILAIDCFSNTSCFLTTAERALRYTGFGLESFAIPSSSRFNSVSSDNNNDACFGGEAVLCVSDGGWSTVRASTLGGRQVSLLAPWSAGAWAVLENGTSQATARFTGSWEVFETDLIAKVGARQLSSSGPNEAWVAGPGGVARFSGSRWVSASTTNALGVYTPGPGEAIVATADGVYAWTGSSFSAVSAHPFTNVQGVTGQGPVVVLYGLDKTLWERRAGTWTEITDVPDCTGSAGPDELVHVALAGSEVGDDLWVLGDCLRLRRGSSWTEVPLPDGASVRRVHAVQNGQVWLEGERSAYFPYGDTDLPFTELWLKTATGWDSETMPVTGVTGPMGLLEGDLVVPLEGGAFLIID